MSRRIPGTGKVQALNYQIHGGISFDMERVTVVEFGGTTAEKILVKDCGEVLLVTTEDEWLAAKAQNRPPISVGFKREYMIERYHKSC